MAASPGRDRAATIYDVAKFAGVSHQTVSRLLKGYEGIRPATRDRVERALRELEYRPNLTARLLTTGRSHRIGALTHEIGQIGPNQILQGAAQAARRAGYVLDIVTLVMGVRDAIAQSLDLITQHDLAGVLVLAATDEMVESFRRIEFRVPVHLSADGEDDRGNGQMQEIDTVMRHLHGLGHRDFFHIAGPSNSPAGRHRSAAYEAALDAYGLSSDGTFIGDWSSASGFAAAALIPPTVTAVVAANDQMALGALLGLSRRGLRVPQDVSVTGIDDIPEAEYFSPPLTTIHLDFIARGASALTALIQQIDSEFPTVTPRPPRLVERMSSGPSRR